MIKKLFYSTVVLSLIFSPLSQAAWIETEPQGSQNLSDIDALIQANNLPLDTIIQNFRSGMFVRQTSTTTITVEAGEIWVDEGIKKTATTVLTISTAGDWAGGVSLRATNTTAYVGIDKSGNIKMHTTAPTHSDYALAVTAGVRRYASWSSTTYRIIGWFRMNATGSGELVSSAVSNIMDVGVKNTIYKESATCSSETGTGPAVDPSKPLYNEGTETVEVNFRATNENSTILIEYSENLAGPGTTIVASLFKNGSGSDPAIAVASTVLGNTIGQPAHTTRTLKAGSITNIVFEIRIGAAGAWTIYRNGNSSCDDFNGVFVSWIRITELEGQLES